MTGGRRDTGEPQSHRGEASRHLLCLIGDGEERGGCPGCGPEEKRLEVRAAGSASADAEQATHQETISRKEARPELSVVQLLDAETVRLNIAQQPHWKRCAVILYVLRFPQVWADASEGEAVFIREFTLSRHDDVPDDSLNEGPGSHKSEDSVRI
ncbi:hypothetical protein P4O66_008401 [Electrophorus voltai]|uniref:Uncharacterized protein n=1 Tax=Electrophorus voltai TaxID=2609070 RepID=A0AAD8ZG98_9TELE|nr:hypothetical protein P4O66_008401 [Electrophorus voltai]